jgi:two-component system, chemotaxis family, sensor kinase Cph1
MIEDGSQLRRHVRGIRVGIVRFIIAASMVLGLGALPAFAAPSDSNGSASPTEAQVQSSESQPDSAGTGDAVEEFFRSAFDTVGFKPLWQRGAWTTAHMWLHIAADLTISAAYLLIPIILVHNIRKHPGVPYTSLFWLFAAFISAAALTHLLDAAMFWWPAYRLTGLVKAGTAVISLATALVLIPVAPRAMAFRKPVDLQREITQRRRTELELRQVHAQLEGVIEQRTTELASKNEELEQFLNTVSHDLKSPVVTCQGLAGILREDIQAGRTEETLDTINRIDRSVARMRQLIDDLLHLSRIGKVRFELADVDTLSIVRSICDEYKNRLEKIGALLQIESNLPSVHADAHWLTEVFENLITNAIKYGCDNPHPSIKIGCITDEREHRFYVRDNGSGIDPAHHAQVLEPFRRLRSDKEGSGMGLAIVVRIIKMHSGRIWIESQPGQGATFWIALPAGVPSEKTKPASMSQSPEAEHSLQGV